MTLPAIPLALLVALHAYIGLRLLPDLPAAGQPAGMALLALEFALVHSGLGHVFGPRPSRGAAAWVGLTALGFFSSLLVLTLLRDVLLLGAAGASWLGLAALRPAPLAGPSAWAVPVLALLASAAGLFLARRRPPVRRVEVPLPGLPEALEGLRIVQISDLHVGPTIRAPFVDKVVTAVNALQPDLVVVTGDSVDGSVAELASHTAPLGRLQGRLGVYAVTGNHEYYSGGPAWIAEFERLGMRVLMNEHVVLEHRGARLVLAGVPDYTAHHFVPAHRSDALRALHDAPADAGVKILLAHQPRAAAAASAAGYDLQLSGHTHGGQFLPWRWFVPLQQPYVSGLQRHAAMWIYISRGTGYWGPPKRLGAPSEITELRLVRGAAG
ncbi:metallophosphoesterase [Aquabacterium sp. A7-Y]|uniref:metallophosphoesterase n=1 Tax=Aquabacterium sp. A7-Y TaxID=1349605 RepID=UPI00223E6E22|nr:metallophosphoesterase [Aquabacterium sp. A7-Y]MCW7537877.1 metallophosphoesterase [Aquabacterium sp. A7-Y]